MPVESRVPTTANIVASEMTEETPRIVMSFDISIGKVGDARLWFAVERHGQAVVVRPTRAVSRRCSVRIAARFDHKLGFPSVCTVMGRLLFLPGAEEAQEFTPFTRDPDRSFAELFLLFEPTPDDALYTSQTRWGNYAAVAKSLLDASGLAWNGLSDRDVQELVAEEPWQEPLEACVLHALSQCAPKSGGSIVEIGSLRGQSLAMLGRGRRSAEIGARFVSIDPHTDRPHDRLHVQAAMAGVGLADRLVQMTTTSDEARAKLSNASASLVFIDGDHSARQVAADFANYRDIVAPGGILAFHDYGYGPHNGQPDVVPDVRPFIDAEVMTSDDFAPVLLAHTLMVFRKR